MGVMCIEPCFMSCATTGGSRKWGGVPVPTFTWYNTQTLLVEPGTTIQALLKRSLPNDIIKECMIVLCLDLNEFKSLGFTTSNGRKLH